MPFDGLLWLLILLGPLLILQRGLHREIQSVFLLVTRRGDISLALFSLLFFPGVLLHEASHYVMAIFLGVQTGRFSLLPQTLENGRLQLGFVETEPTDFFRDALIGAAPLISGGLFVTYAGLERLGFGDLWQTLLGGDAAAFGAALGALPNQNDFWLWFYLALAVSSTMLPSASDRRAWRPLALVLGVLLVVTLLAGAGPWLLQTFGAPLNQALRALAGVLGISMVMHLALWLPAMLLRRLISKITGQEVVG